MIEKIISIKNIGRFRNYNATGDVTCKKLTLVYAENGRGKTTLCAILRSLRSGQPEFIHERKTLDTVDPESVNIRLNGNNYQFTNGSWTAVYEDFAIFDPVFVNDNVYSGDYVEHEQKKNQYRVIVGPHGVQLAKQIENLDRQIRDASTDLRTKKDALLMYLPSGVAFDDYLQWQLIPDIEDQIKKKTEALNKRKHTFAKSGEIQGKALFAKVQIPSLPSDFVQVLSKQLTGIVKDAEIKVRHQIAQHQMGNEGESWLSQGLGYVNNDLCPFCEKTLSGSDLIAAYRSHFNDAYRILKQEVSQLSQRVDSAISETSLASTGQAIAGNNVLFEFWGQFIKISLPEISFSEIQQMYAALREYCMVLAKKKQNRPVEMVKPDKIFIAALDAVETLVAVVNTYNAAVDAANLYVNELKVTSQRESDITILKKELDRLDENKKRFEPEITQVSQAYQHSLTNKADLERKKENIRQQLDQHCRDILRTYEQSINEYLDQFNAGFRITNSRHLYIGGTPSSQYQIEINNTSMDLGDSRTPAGTPCFKTALSSGDRRALALAFFLAVLKQDTNISRKIVVFDDPFTSLDRFRRTCTQQLIQHLSDSAKQVIIFSHDPFFLKLLADECPSMATNVKALQMSKAGDTTVIGEWDIQMEVQTSYTKDYSTLLDFYRERKGDTRAVARTIRPFLEGMLRSHFPGQFQQNEWLGDFINKIRSANATNGLQHAKADINELDSINGYSKKYHHQQNENADSEPINDDELHGYVKRTLRLVGGT